MTLEFPWPVKIVFRNNIFEIHTTTMEKDMSAYLDADVPVYAVQRNLDDRDILKDFKETLGSWVLSPLDINKGLKYLWGKDAIDAPRAAWKGPLSTKINAMDGEYLIKRDDPDEYARAIEAPLLKTISNYRRKARLARSLDD